MAAPKEALTAAEVILTGKDGASINAYQVRPEGDGPFGGVLVIHHLPGWDPGTKEITRRFAAHGYNAICPNLYARQGLDVDPDDAAAATREAGGVPDDQFVDDAFTFPLTAEVARRGGPVYRLGVLALTSVGHCGFALGVGLRALEEIARISATKQRMGATTPIREQQLFQHDFAFQEAALRAARAYAFEVFGAAQAAVERGDALTAEQLHRVRQATTYATRVAAEATRFAYTWAGTDALRPSPLQRCFRDIHAATQHIFVDNSTLTNAAAILLAAYE